MNAIEERLIDEIEAEERSRAALPVQVPAGWTMVPQRPIYEQGEAGIAALGKDDDRDPATIVFDVYTAMLAASPPAPASQALTEERVARALAYESHCRLYGNVALDEQASQSRAIWVENWWPTYTQEAVSLIKRLTNKDAEHG